MIKEQKQYKILFEKIKGNSSMPLKIGISFTLHMWSNEVLPISASSFKMLQLFNVLVNPH